MLIAVAYIVRVWHGAARQTSISAVAIGDKRRHGGTDSQTTRSRRRVPSLFTLPIHFLPA
jgi:hypothetical protein